MIVRSMDVARLVAVIDDDPGVLDSLRFLLELAGHEVTGYRSAAAFLEDLAPQADCMIVDQHMPQMTGLELVARLPEPRRPILLMTGSGSPPIRQRAAELGISGVLEKPLSGRDLLAFVAACLEAQG